MKILNRLMGFIFIAAVAASITVCSDAKPKLNNLVSNPSFEADSAGKDKPITNWTVVSVNDKIAAFVEYGWTHSGQNKFTNWRDSDFKVYTYQTVENIPEGVYNFEFWYANGDGGNDCYVELKDFGADPVKIPVTKSGAWTKKELKDIKIASGKCTIGIYSDAKAGYWINLDDFALYNQKDLAQ